MKKTHLYIAAFATALLCLPGRTSFSAEEIGWTRVQPPCGTIDMTIPEDYTETSSFLRLDDQRVVYGGEVSAVLDMRPYKDRVRRYILRYGQTFGTTTSNEYTLQKLLDDEAQTYIDYYEAANGEVIKQNNMNYKGYMGKELYISYDDPELGRQSVKVMFVFADATKIQAITMGPDDTMNTMQTRDFFETIYLTKGIPKVKGEFTQDWQVITSPQNRFTVSLPPETPVYVPAAPVITGENGNDMLTQKIYDPYWNQFLFYSAYSQKFGSILDKRAVQEILLRKHVGRFATESAKVNFSYATLGPFEMVEASVPVPPMDQAPYVNYMRLRALVYKDTIFVQEIVGSREIAGAPFAQRLIEQAVFHPDGGYNDTEKTQSPAIEAAPAP